MTERGKVGLEQEREENLLKRGKHEMVVREKEKNKSRIKEEIEGVE